MGIEDFDYDLQDAIEDLIADGVLDIGTPAHGIALQVVHDGYESLSDKQRAVFDKHVVPALKRRGERLEIQRRIDSAPD
jgi:hypothetical protein